MALAKRQAEQSEFGDYRHGAILVRGGSVLNASHNKRDDYSHFGARFRVNDLAGTSHAELNCILGIERRVTTGASVYVCRIGRSGEYRMSRPCAMCMAAMRFVGISKVYYTLRGIKNVGRIKL